jgi:DNA polymerase-3 subunit alpha
MRIIRYSDIAGRLSSHPIMRVQLAGVLLKKSEKISQKSGNKFAFLTLSDTSGVYEVLLFSETLTRSREFLEVGKSILLSADAEFKDDAIRLTVQDVKPLDEMLIDRVNEIALTLDHSNQMDELKTALNRAGDGKSAITITIHSPAANKMVKLRLPKHYNFTPELRDELYRLKGLRKLMES